MAIIGYGKNALQHVEALQDIAGVEITAIVEVPKSQLKELRAKFPDVNFYQDYNEMFRKHFVENHFAALYIEILQQSL